MVFNASTVGQSITKREGSTRFFSLRSGDGQHIVLYETRTEPNPLLDTGNSINRRNLIPANYRGVTVTPPCLAEVPIPKTGHLPAEILNNSANRGWYSLPCCILEQEMANGEEASSAKDAEAISSIPIFELPCHLD